MNLLSRASHSEDYIENPHLAKKMNMKFRLSIFIIVFVLILTVFFLTWYIGYNRGVSKSAAQIDKLNAEVQELQQELDYWKNNPVVIDPLSPEIVLDVIKTEYAEIDELATAEYLFTDSSRFSDPLEYKNWKIPFTE